MVAAKCAECGLLALSGISTRKLEPADGYFREHSQPSWGPQVDFSSRFEDIPVCAGGVRDFEGIVEKQFQGGQEKRISLVSLLREGFDCPEFVRWRRGLSIEAHHQMIDRQRFQEFQIKREDDWQKFQMQMTADDKKWREEQEAKAEQRHKQELATLRTINKTQLIVMGFAVTVAILVVTIVSAVIGGAVQAGWFPKWFGVGQVEQPIIQPASDTPSVQPLAVSEGYPETGRDSPVD